MGLASQVLPQRSVEFPMVATRPVDKDVSRKTSCAHSLFRLHSSRQVGCSQSRADVRTATLAEARREMAELGTRPMHGCPIHLVGQFGTRRAAFAKRAYRPQILLV